MQWIWLTKCRFYLQGHGSAQGEVDPFATLGIPQSGFDASLSSILWFLWGRCENCQSLKEAYVSISHNWSKRNDWENTTSLAAKGLTVVADIEQGFKNT